MKRLFMCFLILLLAIWVGLKMQADAGYVLIAYDHYSIEISLWMAIGVLLLAMVMLDLIVRLLKAGAKLPRCLSGWSLHRQKRKAHALITQGVCQLLEGRWAKAEKLFVRSVKESDTVLVNYLGAAKAAYYQNDKERCERYLARAREAAKGAENVIQLELASWQIERRKFHNACEILEALHRREPKHPRVLALLQSVYIELKAWERLRALLPALKKYRELKEAALKALPPDRR